MFNDLMNDGLTIIPPLYFNYILLGYNVNINSGLWVQWGKYATKSNGGTKTWPISFKTKFLQVAAGPQCNNSNSLTMQLCPYSCTKTGFTNDASASAVTISYVCVGK